MQEDIWEYALKRISVEAFDDLLTCGVRSLNGLLRLTPEDMRTHGVSEHIQHEIQNIQNQLHSYQEPSVVQDEHRPEEIVDKHNEHSEKSIETKCVSDDGENHPTIRFDEQLFERLVERLPTRAKRALIWAEIWTAEQLMELTEEVLFKIPSIGRKTVHDIKHLQVKIKIQSENAQSPIEQDKIEKPEGELKPYPFRIRFLPKSSEHWLSDPAKWSLLSHSLQELFGITFPHFDAYSNNISISIRDLDISEPDMFRLREVSLLPDDTVDLLFSMSLGYIVKTGISSDAFTKIVNCFAHYYGHNDLLDFRAISRKFANVAIFNNICLDSISEFRINSLLCVDLFNLLDNKNFIIWEELQNITESEIIEKLGLNLISLNVINCAWGLKEVAHKLIDGSSDSLPIQAYDSFQNLTEAFVRTLLRKPYHYSVLMGRLGFLDGRHWTLEELGQSINVTRERVRQIEKEYLPKLKKPETQRRLSLLWHSFNDILNSCGGVCCISEVTAFLVKKWSWPVQPSDEAIASLIGLSSKYEMIWASPARIILPDHECVKCKEIGTVFTEIVEKQPTGTLCFSVAKNAMLSFCKEKSCAFVRDISVFSDGYIHFLDEAIEEILADEDTLYTQSAWVKKYGKSLTGLVESIMRDAGRAMHFTEVSAEINKDRPEHEKIADRNVHAGLTRSSEVILWDRGTFIHSDHVSIPKDIICKIEKEIIRRLDCGIPFLVVNGIYKLFIDELTAKNVSRLSRKWTFRPLDLMVNQLPLNA